MGVNGVPIFYIEKSLFLGAINHCFDNKSQTDPSPCTAMIFPMISGGQVMISFTIFRIFLADQSTRQLRVKRLCKFQYGFATILIHNHAVFCIGIGKSCNICSRLLFKTIFNTLKVQLLCNILFNRKCRFTAVW